MDTNEVEGAVVNYLNVRRHIIVPNVYTGMFKYELDLCAVDWNSRYAKEVEIKISKSDLKRDLEKPHKHENKMIKFLWFAMPETMRDCVDLVPDRAGVYLIHEPRSSDLFGEVEILRRPEANKIAKKWNDTDLARLARLGVMRFWDEKKLRLSQ